MKIHKIEVKGFKSVASLSLENFSPFLVFAGPNGTGKSNITDALAFIGAVVKRGASQALREYGGFQHIHCFKFRKEQRTTISFFINIEIEDKLYEYNLKIRNLNKTPDISETLKINQSIIIDRKTGSDTRVSLDGTGDLQSLSSYSRDMTALMLFSDNQLYQFLTNIKVFRIDPIAAKEPDSSTTDATALDPYGKNVATMLSMLEKDKDFREQILEWIELIVPGMENVSTEKQRLDGSTVITFKEEGTKARFPAKLISDGTIYALCILTAVLSRAQTTGITIIEEPERGIHPKAIGELVHLMRENSNIKHPILLTTHSESVVRNLELNELFFVGKKDGKTHIHSAEHSGIDKKEIPLDTAWLTNLFDGGLPW
ncbi:AAA family ATPase [Vibrio fluvialis]|nr:AAA family ATPase [Vibrio fluvialis]EKO3528263.1 AAA family ATPase [Vibrio fluvialis]